MAEKIHVAILDDHPSIIDGYVYRLSFTPEIKVVATGCYGEELDSMLAESHVDVLLLDVSVPTSKDNLHPFPILHTIPQLLQAYPHLNILVISMHDQRNLIKAVLEAGASGYIFKDDHILLKELGATVRSLAHGGICISRSIHEMLLKGWEQDTILTPRQGEILSLLTAYPDLTVANAAIKLNITHSTARSLMSGAYLRLGVRNRSAAIAKARQLGLVTPIDPSVDDTLIN
jgi:DNA-binding NarL/FixJ family response regulator